LPGIAEKTGELTNQSGDFRLNKKESDRIFTKNLLDRF